MKNFYKNKKILITGHTGFKGGWLARILTNWGADVVGVSLPAHTEPNLFSIFQLKDRLRHYEVDICNYEELLPVFKKEQPEIVFHLAAQALVRDSYDIPLLTHKVNVFGTAVVMHAIKETPSVAAAVIITTDKVYYNDEKGRPYKEIDPLGGHDPYSASKAAADIIANSYVQSFLHLEKYGNEHKTLTGIVRSGNVFGGGDWSKDRLVPDIIRAVYHDNSDVVLRNPTSVRPWQHVLEPTSGYLLLAKKLYEGDKKYAGAWNFGPNDEMSCSVENMVQRALLYLGRGTYVIVPDKTKPEAGILRLDISKAKELLGWAPRIDLATSLRWTFEWYKSHYEKQNAGEVADRQINDFFG